MDSLRRILLTIFLLFITTAVADAWTGKVVSVTDGDTIKVLRDGRQVKIRLYGIDCPEKRLAYGQAARRFTASLVAGKIVSIDECDTDRYGRSVAVVRVGGDNVNADIIANGYAWVYRKYCRGLSVTIGDGLRKEQRAWGMAFGPIRIQYSPGSGGTESKRTHNHPAPGHKFRSPGISLLQPLNTMAT